MGGATFCTKVVPDKGRILANPLISRELRLFWFERLS